MMIIYTLLISYTLYRAIRGNVRTINSVKWILSEQKELNDFSIKSHSDNDYKFVILIPVLREQEIIKKTFETFTSLSGEYEIIFITTQKEDFQEDTNYHKILNLKKHLLKISDQDTFLEITSGLFPKSEAIDLFNRINKQPEEELKWSTIINVFKSKKHTRQIIKNLISSNSVKNVHIFDYPFTEGVMAHQLNFACKKIAKMYDSDRTFILVYNADSIVPKDLITFIHKYIQFHPDAKIIQQSSLFTENYDEYRGIRGSFLQAIALLQCRWTLAHELPRILSQYKSKLGALTEGAHVVGHGLCARLDRLRQVGYFPTSTINEDLPLGYLLRLNGETIYPLPLLENSQNPQTVKSMFTQYRTWFYGLLYYPLYVRNALTDKRFSKTKVIIWGTRYIIRGVFWFVLSFVWVFLFLYPLLLKNYWMFALTISVFTVYAPLNFIIQRNLINKNAKTIFHDNHPKIKLTLSVCLMTIPAYFTHSFGPVLAATDLLKKMFFKQEIIKNKTER